MIIVEVYDHEKREVAMVFYGKLSAGIAAILGYGFLLWLAPFSVWAFLLGVPVCFFLAALFHELGHVLAYKLLDIPWKRMVISFLEFRPGQGLQINRQQKPFAASCTCAYLETISYGRYRIALLSGGFMCLILAAIALPFGHPAQGGLQAFLLLFGTACAINGLLTLLPFSADRALLRQIKKERE